MVKRLFDIVFSILILALFSPLLVVVALLIRASSPGPAIYRATRVGKNGRTFTMHKFRSMHIDHGDNRSTITGANDSRIFPVGAFIRDTKIDEMPQFFDVILGKMSVVGPRPEDPIFVAEYYTDVHRETLAVTPGMASPGSIYNFTHSNLYIGDEDPERDYIEKFMHIKLALDVVYVREASFAYDMRIIGRTLSLIWRKLTGKDEFADPPELERAGQMGLFKGIPTPAGVETAEKQ